MEWWNSVEALRSLRLAIGIIAAFFAVLAVTIDVRIRTLDRPRRITARVQSAIVESLRPHPFAIELTFPVGDREAQAFALQIADSFRKSGWTVSPLGATNYPSGAPVGIRLVTSGHGTAFEYAAGVAIEALGQPLKTHVDPTLSSIRVLVEVKR